MGLVSWLLKGRGRDVEELARRLGADLQQLEEVVVHYREFSIPKRSGGVRRVFAPAADLKTLQRRILRRLFARLKAHPAAMAYERGRSIVTNARAHQGQAVVLRFDLVDFFPSTGAGRLRRYFRRIGFNRPATDLLLRWCTYRGGLPQGAPTSPRLSNLVNYRLDARLSGMATAWGGVYTRYADDITVSFAEDDRRKVTAMQRFVRRVVEQEGYRLHRRKKQSVRRRHQRQIVTGLVVNDGVNLPREVRRWLRAVEHRSETGSILSLSDYQPFDRPSRKPPTLTPEELEGWLALRSMVDRQGRE